MKSSNVILLNSIQSNQHFLKILTHIQSLTDIEEKIIYLQNIKINIYDLLTYWKMIFLLETSIIYTFQHLHLMI